jgi:hypothetical protein
VNRLFWATLVALSLLSVSDRAKAFAHIVERGETLASIAEMMYGRIQYEQILVAANSLDIGGGVPIVAGMRLEIPAVEHRRVVEGDTWADLAKALLGGAHRADVLSMANGSYPWLPPEIGAEIVVPYNLRVVATGNETIVTMAYRYLGSKEKAWTLDHYNGRGGKQLHRGDVLLIPLTDLPLTDAGKRAAERAAAARRSEGAGSTRQAQLEVQREMVALIADVRGGRYVDAVRRGNEFLAKGSLTQPQLATIHRQLLEAYVALGATGLAKQSCRQWQKNDADARLDPVRLSPKILEACGKAP